MTVEWFCKHGQVGGEVTVADTLTIDVGKLLKAVQSQHQRACKIGEYTSFLVEISEPGDVYNNEGYVLIRLQSLKLWLLHVQ